MKEITKRQLWSNLMLQDKRKAWEWIHTSHSAIFLHPENKRTNWEKSGKTSFAEGKGLIRHEILSTKPINNMKFIYCTLEKFLDRIHARNYLRSSCLVNQCYFSLLDGGPPEKEGEVAICFHLRLPVLAQRRLQDSLWRENLGKLWL